jgi:hypothetical protein
VPSEVDQRPVVNDAAAGFADDGGLHTVVKDLIGDAADRIERRHMALTLEAQEIDGTSDGTSAIHTQLRPRCKRFFVHRCGCSRPSQPVRFLRRVSVFLKCRRRFRQLAALLSVSALEFFKVADAHQAFLAFYL